MISVIIPAKNSAPTIQKCLDAVQSAGPFHEVIVVDDAGTDDTARIARSSGCTVVSHTHASGAAAARNTGARQATGDILFFTDSDIEIPPDTRDKIQSYFETPESTAMIGILRAETTDPGFASRYENYYMHRHYLFHPGSISIFYTSAAAIRREVFLELGGFDENYRGASIEDMEFGRRISAAGHRIVIDKTFQVHHLKRFSVMKLLRTNLNKAAGTLKISLRNRLIRTDPSNLVAPPRSFLAGIPLTSLGLLGVILGCLLKSWTVCIFALFLWVATCLLNTSWLIFLKQNAGMAFMLKGSLFLLANFIAYALGIAWGGATFFLGKRY